MDQEVEKVRRPAPDEALEKMFGPRSSEKPAPTNPDGAAGEPDENDDRAGSDDSVTDRASEDDGEADDDPKAKVKVKGIRNRAKRFRRRRPKLTVAAAVLVVLAVYPAFTYVGALTKPGSESLTARTAEWARDMHLGFAVDRIEQIYFSRDQYADGGVPDAGLLAMPSTTATTTTTPTGSTVAQPAPTTTIPHLALPARLASPAPEILDGEGEWIPAGPPIKGLHGVYYTKVRPNATKTSLLVFVAWMDPKLVSLKLFPGTDLPGGEWATPHYLTPELCPSTVIAMNGGFRMDQARGGYWAEGREPYPLRDGAASLIFYKDGTVGMGQWGRDFTHDDLAKGTIDAVRQNLELMVDNGVPSPDLTSDKDWGAKLKNVYFMWRSGYGITKDGALVYAGGPGLTPADLAQTLINAGAINVMEGDINPEWVTANLFTLGADGACVGAAGLPGLEAVGGQRQPPDRYLDTDTRDFIAAQVRPL